MLPSYIVTSSAPVSDVADADVLASSAGAATIGIADSGEHFTATTVEGALTELGVKLANPYADGTYTFDGATPGVVQSITITNGIITDITFVAGPG